MLSIMIWEFIQNQILGMKWMSTLIGNLLEKIGLDTSSRMGGSVQFFLYDVLKITILLCILIFMISYIQSYFPPERSKKIMGRFHGIWANCIAALLGTVTPFCSCSSIPLFIGFTSAGLPLGVTFSFLISSPMVDLGSLVLLMSIFGSKVAIIYVIVGLVIAVIGGTIIEKLHLENEVEAFIRKANAVDIDMDEPTQKERLSFAKQQVIDTFKKVFPYILIGVGIGAVIHNWIPESWGEKILGSDNPYPTVPALLKNECPELYANYLKLIEGEKSNPLAVKQTKNEVSLLPQEYLETDIYKASREIKKMQKLNSNVLTTWYDIVPERNELPCKKLVSNKE